MRRIIYENRASLFIIKSRASLWIVDRGAMREAKEEKIGERIDDRWGTRSSHYKFYEFEKGNNDYWLGKRSGKFTGDVSCLPRRRCYDKFRAHEKSNPYYWKIEVTIGKKKKRNSWKFLNLCVCPDFIASHICFILARIFIVNKRASDNWNNPNNLVTCGANRFSLFRASTPIMTTNEARFIAWKLIPSKLSPAPSIFSAYTTNSLGLVSIDSNLLNVVR